MTTEIYKGTEYAGTRTRVEVQESGHHQYDVIFEKTDGDEESTPGDKTYLNCIDFQEGPVKEVGLTGIQDEGLLAVLIHRYQQFQAGPFPCAENEVVLGHLQAAHRFMEERKKDRIKRGVATTDRM